MKRRSSIARDYPRTRRGNGRGGDLNARALTRPGPSTTVEPVGCVGKMAKSDTSAREDQIELVIESVLEFASGR